LGGFVHKKRVFKKAVIFPREKDSKVCSPQNCLGKLEFGSFEKECKVGIVKIS